MATPTSTITTVIMTINITIAKAKQATNQARLGIPMTQLVLITSTASKKRKFIQGEVTESVKENQSK